MKYSTQSPRGGLATTHIFTALNKCQLLERVHNKGKDIASSKPQGREPRKSGKINYYSKNLHVINPFTR